MMRVALRLSFCGLWLGLTAAVPARAQAPAPPDETGADAAEARDADRAAAGRRAEEDARRKAAGTQDEPSEAPSPPAEAEPAEAPPETPAPPPATKEEKAAKKKAEAEARKKAQAERRQKAREAREARKKARAEARAKARAERAAKKAARAEAKAKAREAKEAKRRAARDAATRAKAAEEEGRHEEAAAKARAEAEAREKADEEAKARAAEDVRTRAQAEADRAAAVATATQRVGAMAMALRETLHADEQRIGNAAREMALVGEHGGPALADLLTDPVPEVRRAAALALAALQLPDSLSVLISRMGDDDPVVAAAVVRAVSTYDDPWTIKALIRWLGHSDAQVVDAVLDGLAMRDRAQIQTLIRRLLESPPVSTGPGPYLAALGRFPDARTVPDLFQAMANDALAPHALRGLTYYGDKISRQLARWVAAHAAKQPETGKAAARVLVGYGASGQGALVAVLASLPLEVKREAIQMLVGVDEDKGAKRITGFSAHRDAEVRLLALGMMNDIEGADPLPSLRSNLSHKDRRVRLVAATMLQTRGRSARAEREIINRYREVARHRRDANVEERNVLLRSLGRVGRDQGVAELIQAIGHEEEMEAAVYALGTSGGRAIGALLFIIKTGDPVRTPLAVEALAKAGPDALQPLMKLLVHRSREVRYTARRAVAEMGITEIVPQVIKLIENKRTPGRPQLLALLGRLYCPESFDALKEVARAGVEHEMRYAAVRVLSRHADPEVLPVLRDAARSDGNNEVRHLAVQALIWHGDTTAVPMLIKMLAHERDFIRKTIAQGLGYLAQPKHIMALIERMDTPRNEIITAIRNSIRRIMFRPDLHSTVQFEDWVDAWEDRDVPPPVAMKASHITLGDGTQMHFWLGGMGRPLLVLHDGPDLSHGYLRPATEALADDHLMLYVDLPGRGESSRPTRADVALGLEHDAQAVATLLVRINLRDVDVYGHGWGALVAARLAEKHPKLVRKMVLDNTPLPTLLGWAGRIEQAAKRVPAPWSEDLALFEHQQQHFNPSVRDHFLSVALMTGSLRKVAVVLDVATKLERDPALRGDIIGPMGNFDYRETFANISKPTLLLYGNGSPLDEETVKWRDQLAKTNDHVTKLVLVGTGLLPFYEYPKPWKKHVGRFLR